MTDYRIWKSGVYQRTVSNVDRVVFGRTHVQFYTVTGGLIHAEHVDNVGRIDVGSK